MKKVKYINQPLSSKIFKWIIGETIYNKIFRLYFLFVLLGAFLLFLPFSLANGWSWSTTSYAHSSSSEKSTFTIFDSLFTSISAFTNTGLTTHTTSSTFSFAGQVIILLLIQTGGIGFLTLLVFLWNFASRSKKFNVESRAHLHFERGGNSGSSSLRVVKTGILVLLITEIIGAIILTLLFYFYTPTGVSTPSSSSSSSSSGSSTTITLKGDLLNSIWAGIFHSVSGTNNAGFDILGSKSIETYRNDLGNILSVVLLFQSLIGGIGYPVFYDLFKVFKNRKKNLKWEATLFTKVSISMYLLISFLAVYLVLFFEVTNKKSFLYTDTNNWGTNGTANKFWNLIYLTFSARSAGFAGLETDLLTAKTRWILSILMFIGASPTSTGGGIRTVTLFLICAKIQHIFRGRKHLSVYKRTVSSEIVDESMIVALFAILLIVCFSVFIITTNDAATSIDNVLFEAASAFGTAGLTSKVTRQTNFFGQTLLLILMFVGQLGISNTLLAWAKRRPNNQSIQYLNESIRII